MAIADFVLDTTRGDNPISSNLEGDSAPQQQVKVADFLTLQSLTYSGSLLAIGVIWALAQRLSSSDLARGPLVPVGLSALLVLAGYLNAWDDLRDTSKRLAALIIAGFNAALLAAGALGITTALK